MHGLALDEGLDHGARTLAMDVGHQHVETYPGIHQHLVEPVLLRAAHAPSFCRWRATRRNWRICTGGMKQRPGGLAERQMAEFVEDHEIHAQQARRDAPGLALRLLLLQRVDQIDGRVEAHPFAVARDARHTDGGRQVRLAGAGSTDQHGVLV